MLQPSIMLISGDSTSDRFGAGLAGALKAAAPNTRLFGIGGTQMQEAGVEILYNTADLDNLGILDGFRGRAVLKRVVRKANQMMENYLPRVVVQIGLPVFDYRLMELARCKDIPVVYYCTPFSSGFGSVKPERLAGLLTAVAAVTRREVEVWTSAGIPNRFVGHPLVDLGRRVSQAEARRHYGFSQEQPVVTLMPGNRDIEVKAALPILLRAAARMQNHLPGLQMMLAQPRGVSSDVVERILSRHSVGPLVHSRTVYKALQAADLAVIYGGSSCLEAALLGIPALAVYKAPSSTYLMDKMLERKAHVALPNILLNREVIPELIQNEFTDANTASCMQELLSSPDEREAMKEEYGKLSEQVGRPGALQRAATFVLEMGDWDEQSAKKGSSG